MTRRLSAKHPGQCGACNGPIRVGDAINWQPRGKAWHVNCDQAERAQRAADARSSYLAALGKLNTLFSDAPIYTGTLPDACDRICVRDGFPGWSQIVYLVAGEAILWTNGSDYPKVAQKAQSLPLTDELRALSRAATYVPGPEGYR